MGDAGLAAYGWDDAWARAAAAGPDGVPGRIVRVDRGECDVAVADGVVRVVSDSMRAQDEVAPATGDWVVLSAHPELGWTIAAVLPRRKTLTRRQPGDAELEQVLVANIDVGVIVHGLDRDLPPGRLERFLVLVRDSGAETVVVMTKADQLAPAEVDEAVADVVAVAPDVPIVVVDAKRGIGLEPLRTVLDTGATMALVGVSGAGKSTLINALIGSEVLATGAVRGIDAKGRHTTVARELVLRPGGGLLIDTPGVRAIGLWESEEALEEVFGDIERLAERCRFNDCGHVSEPGCAVLAEVGTGALDPRRVNRYLALQAELSGQRNRQVERQRKEYRSQKRSNPRNR